VILLRDREEPAHELDAAHLIDVDLMAVAAGRVPHDLHRGQQQHPAEEQERPGAGLEHGRARRDEDAPQHEGAGNAVEQHPLGQRRGHRERAEQQHEDEQVVDRQGLLDHEAGVELDRRAAAVRPPEHRAEHGRQHQVEDRPAHRLAHRHVVGPAGDHEIGRQQADEDRDADRPQLRGCDGLERGSKDHGWGHGGESLLGDVRHRPRSPSPVHQRRASARGHAEMPVMTATLFVRYSPRRGA
jgi:hypothetical protein